jgi:putative transcriptional regulator
MKNLSFGDEIVEGLKEFTESLESRESIGEKFTMRKIVLDLKPTTYTPQEVKQARKLLGASQAVFAEFIGVAVSTVRAWEQGGNPVTGAAARLMDEIRHDPAAWRQRLQALAVEQSGT